MDIRHPKNPNNYNNIAFYALINCSKLELQKLIFKKPDQDYICGGKSINIYILFFSFIKLINYKYYITCIEIKF